MCLREAQTIEQSMRFRLHYILYMLHEKRRVSMQITIQSNLIQ